MGWAPRSVRLAALIALAAGCGDDIGGGAGGDGGRLSDAQTRADGGRSDAGGSDAVASDAGGSDTLRAPDGSGVDAQPGSDGGGGSGLQVSGNHLVDGSGRTVRLLGVNRSGTEYACIQGFGFFDGPSDDASIQSIVGWHANAVRVPLNEDCWLAINGAPAAYAGSAYQLAISGFVTRLRAHNLYPILELHWSAPGAQQATSQQPMPDRDHSVTFWSQVANFYKTDLSVVLELFNEPFPDSNRDTDAAWACWRDGGTCPGFSYQAAGMQELVDAVRATGAQNVILLGGVQYSNALSQWLTHKPNDPTGNLAASWHIYNFNLCSDGACYDAHAGLVAQQVPVVATEIGEDDCMGSFITPLMSWLDGHGGSYLAWTWDTWGGCLVLITNYNGTPNGMYGQTFHDHLMSIMP